jgi:hypothetical protein
MPKKHIFIDSHSSLLPGLTASFNVLAHCDRKDLKPILPNQQVRAFDKINKHFY